MASTSILNGMAAGMALIFGGGVLDAHVGYEAGAFYIQGGPSVLMPDGGEAEPVSLPRLAFLPL